EYDCKPAGYQPAKVGYHYAARNRHQVKLHGYEFVSCQRRIAGVGNQFQKCAPARIAHDSHIAPGSLRLHVDQVLGLRSSDERWIGRVTQPQPYETLFIVCIRLFGRSLELGRAGKRLQLGEEMDEVEHVDRLAIVRLGPRAETGSERLNPLARQR